MSNSQWTKRNWTLTIFACLLTALATYAVSNYCQYAAGNKDKSSLKSIRSHVKALRIQDYRFTKPLLMSELDSENDDLAYIKNEVLSIIMQAKSSGNLTDAAVFMKDLTNGDWFTINPDGFFDPGSIMKLPILIAHLKQEELTPGHLNKQYKLNSPMSGMPVQTVQGKSIELGKAYTVSELLRYMIVESDNQANALLNQIVNPLLVQKFFKDLGLPVPSAQQSQVLMKVADVSKFMHLLYNATYLRNDLSEYALELLSETRFRDGIRSVAPAGIPICSKFGERGQLGTDVFEIHETSIVYLDNSPFLFTLMTRGNNRENQQSVIQRISAAVIRLAQGSPLS
jgi:beta-lactamase class A